MNTIHKTLSALVATAFVSCSDPTPTRTEQTPPPTPESLALKNDDCGVGKLHEALYETITDQGYDYEGLRREGISVVRSPSTIETSISMDVAMANRRGGGVRWVNKVGHDRTVGMYVRDISGEPAIYFREGYVPLGDEMACALTGKLLKVAELAKVKVP